MTMLLDNCLICFFVGFSDRINRIYRIWVLGCLGAVFSDRINRIYRIFEGRVARVEGREALPNPVNLVNPVKIEQGVNRPLLRSLFSDRINRIYRIWVLGCLGAVFSDRINRIYRIFEGRVARAEERESLPNPVNLVNPVKIGQGVNRPLLWSLFSDRIYRIWVLGRLGAVFSDRINRIYRIVGAGFLTPDFHGFHGFEGGVR